MSENWKYLAGPILRGLTFDGTKGLFVHYHRGEPASSDAKTLILPEEAEDFAASCKDEFLSYCSINGTCPGTIRLGSSGWITLGRTYQDALDGAPLDFVPGSGLEPSRDQVVSGKIALVTGGAQGFGEGMVRSLAEAGAFVYIADLQYEKARQLSDELDKEHGSRITFPVKVDVTDEKSVEDMFQVVSLQTGGLDICISNAGVLKAGSVKEMSIQDFDFVTKVDYTGFFICTKHAARLLSLQNSSCGAYYTDIIAVSSKSGLEGSNKNGAYAGAKFGTIGLTQSFALELIEDNIKVNALCPGNFLDGPLWSDPERGLFVQYLKAGKVPGARTVSDVRRFYEDKVPMKRGCRTEDVMKAVFYVVEQNYETGQAIPVTGGQVMLN